MYIIYLNHLKFNMLILFKNFRCKLLESNEYFNENTDLSILLSSNFTLTLDSTFENLTSELNNSDLLWNISKNYSKSYKYLNFETITTSLPSFVTSSSTMNILFNVQNLESISENSEYNDNNCANYDLNFYENLNSVNLRFFLIKNIFIIKLQ